MRPHQNRLDRFGQIALSGRMDWQDESDATGLLCPLPVLRARKRLKALKSGEVLRLIATDPAAVIDVPHFCNEAGHELISVEEDGARQIYLIRRG